MAILLDDKVREEIARRCAHGQDAALLLHLAHQRCLPEVLRVSWASRQRQREGMVLQHVGDVALYMQPLVARYAAWHDLTITIWRLGPVARLELVDELRVTLEMEDWARTHVDAGQNSAMCFSLVASQSCGTMKPALAGRPLQT